MKFRVPCRIIPFGAQRGTLINIIPTAAKFEKWNLPKMYVDERNKTKLFELSGAEIHARKLISPEKQIRIEFD